MTEIAPECPIPEYCRGQSGAEPDDFTIRHLQILNRDSALISLCMLQNSLSPERIKYYPLLTIIAACIKAGKTPEWGGSRSWTAENFKRLGLLSDSEI